MAKELSQPEQRRGAVFTDQHGREWTAPIDIRNGHAVGPFQPRFTAPWIPDHFYFRHDANDARKIHIEYGRMLATLRDAHSTFDELRLRTAMDMYGAAFHTMLKDDPADDPPQLRKKIGAPPSDLAFPEAAQEGNRWVLGFSAVVPKWAQAILDRERMKTTGRKYLDADEAADLDEQFDPDAVGGKVAPVAKAKKKVAA